MKNLLLLLLLFITTISFAQKPKTTPKVTTGALATFENLKAEIITEGGKQKLAIIIDNAGKKENIILKEINTKDKTQQPNNFKIKTFTVAGVKLYHFSYTENIITETKLKSVTSQKTLMPTLCASFIVSSGEPKEVKIKSTFSSHKMRNCSLYFTFDLFTIKLNPKLPPSTFAFFSSMIALRNSSKVL